MTNRTAATLLALLSLAHALQACQQVSPPECDGSDVSYHEHEDCSLFYRCEDGNFETFACPAKQKFSTDLVTCLPEAEVPCIRCRPSLLQKIKQFFQPPYKQIAVDANFDEECGEVPTCGIFEWGVTKPYPPDCTLYISCDSSGNAVVKSCPEGEHYSPTEFKCMAEELAMCPVCDAATTAAY